MGGEGNGKHSPAITRKKKGKGGELHPSPRFNKWGRVSREKKDGEEGGGEKEKILPTSTLFAVT